MDGQSGLIAVHRCTWAGDVSSKQADCMSTPNGDVYASTGMSTQESPAKIHLPSLRHRPNSNVEDQTDISMRPHRKNHISSSLDSIRVSPRAQTMARHSRRASDTIEHDEVQLSLLSQENEPHDDAASFDNVHKKNKTLSVKDRNAMALLIVLCPSPPSHHLSPAAHPPQTSFKEFR